MSYRPILITGATGIMGSWVLGEALNRGYTPVVLMRDADNNHARERLAAVLRLVGQEDSLDKVRIVRGDTRNTDLGLSNRDRLELRATLHGMVHCAACTSFDNRRDTELWATNVGGVANVLNFLDNSGVPLYHVSTAYVCGTREGRALETERLLDQEFRNTYENSKCEAEGLVQTAMAEGRLTGAIFRPGIIVGATNDGGISQFLNFYSFMRFLDIAATHKVNTQGRLRMVGSPEATKNLVPVDWTAQALWHIIEAEGPLGHTYHLTNPQPVRHSAIMDWAASYFGADRFQFELVESLDGNGTALEGVVSSAFRHYRAYMTHEPHFDRTNTDRALGDALPFPKLGPDFFTALLNYARDQKWQGVFGCRTSAADSGYEAFFRRILRRLEPSVTIEQDEVESLDECVPAAP